MDRNLSLLQDDLRTLLMRWPPSNESEEERSKFYSVYHSYISANSRLLEEGINGYDSLDTDQRRRLCEEKNLTTTLLGSDDWGDYVRRCVDISKKIVAGQDAGLLKIGFQEFEIVARLNSYAQYIATTDLPPKMHPIIKHLPHKLERNAKVLVNGQDIQVSLTVSGGTYEENEAAFQSLSFSGIPQPISKATAASVPVDPQEPPNEALMHAYRIALNVPSPSWPSVRRILLASNFLLDRDV